MTADKVIAFQSRDPGDLVACGQTWYVSREGLELRRGARVPSAGRSAFSWVLATQHPMPHGPT